MDARGRTYEQQHDTTVNRIQEFIAQSSLSSSIRLNLGFEIRRIRLVSPSLKGNPLKNFGDPFEVTS